MIPWLRGRNLNLGYATKLIGSTWLLIATGEVWLLCIGESFIITITQIKKTDVDKIKC